MDLVVERVTEEEIEKLKKVFNINLERFALKDLNFHLKVGKGWEYDLMEEES